jgi:hypothetical protein
MVRLRDALLTQTYARAGASYHPDWAFHQLARGWNLGAPLSESYRVAVGATQYAIQVYATDTLYNVIPNWSDVRRLSQLTIPGTTRPAVLSLADERAMPAEPPEALISDDARLEPAPAPFHILAYSPRYATPTAYGTRSGSKIALIVLHADVGPAAQSLAAMTAETARSMPHYYVAGDGAIYQLTDDTNAAWHAGMATWNGRRQNINRISVGITAERGVRGYTDTQLAALGWLIETLCRRHGIGKAAVMRWSDLDAEHGADPAGFPWKEFMARLIGNRS